MPLAVPCEGASGVALPLPAGAFAAGFAGAVAAGAVPGIPATDSTRLNARRQAKILCRLGRFIGGRFMVGLIGCRSSGEIAGDCAGTVVPRATAHQSTTMRASARP